MKPITVLSVILFFSLNTISAQDFNVWNTSRFTWEGAFEGNQAIWKGGDTLNTYNVGGIDIKVAILDTFDMNTTPTNLSEFNDFTKSNAFYGRGSLALQMKAQNSKQSVCMEYAFQKPVVLEDFYLYDIDMKQNTSNLLSSWVDSVSIFAISQLGRVPVELSYVSETPAFTIIGQTARANFRAGVDGDLRHTDPNGALKFHTKLPIEILKICFNNGSKDDGLSNSHALKIPEFKFKEVVGSISGSVSDRKNNVKLSGYSIRLIDPVTNLVIVNKNGDLMQTVTDENGLYKFDVIPMGLYKIVKSGNENYESDNDIDGINDGTISVILDLSKTSSISNDFYEKPKAPLPVRLKNIYLTSKGNHLYNLSWEAASEINCDFYTVKSTVDHKNHEILGQIKSFNQPQSAYSFDFTYDFSESDILYINLSQTDFDGTETDLYLGKISGEKSHGTITLSPNPFKESVSMILTDPSGFENANILNVTGQIIFTQKIVGQTNIFDLNTLPNGVYYLQLTGKSSVTKKIIKF